MRLVTTVSGMPLLQDDDRLIEFSHNNRDEIVSVLAVEPDIREELLQSVIGAIAEMQDMELKTESMWLMYVIDQMTMLHPYRMCLDFINAADSLRSQIESEQADASEKVSGMA